MFVLVLQGLLGMVSKRVKQCLFISSQIFISSCQTIAVTFPLYCSIDSITLKTMYTGYQNLN